MSVPTQRLRVLVVEDSEPDRKRLVQLISRDPRLLLLGWSPSGQQAVQTVARLEPDVITLDEPLATGLETVRHIMRDCPTPIVMVADLDAPTGDALVQAATAVGVLAVQDKTSLTRPSSQDELLRLIHSMARVRLVRRRREPVVIEPGPGLPKPVTGLASGPPQVIAVGASTGGPHAVRSVLADLPPTFPIPILVVQHTTAGSIGSFADWLGAQTRLPVRAAAEGDVLDRAGVWLAPTDRHLVVRGRQLALLDAPPCSLHRPSATVLFRSVAAAYGQRAVGVVLTGMGDDGARGLLEMRQSGAVTVAQDEASSVVFGMPAEAIRLGAASVVLPLSRIPAFLLRQEADRQALAA